MICYSVSYCGKIIILYLWVIIFTTLLVVPHFGHYKWYQIPGSNLHTTSAISTTHATFTIPTTFVDFTVFFQEKCQKLEAKPQE